MLVPDPPARRWRARLMLAAVAVLNGELLAFLARRGGARLAFGGGALHTLYLLYSSLVFGIIAGPSILARRALPILLVATLLKGLSWCALVPPWHAPDERTGA